MADTPSPQSGQTLKAQTLQQRITALEEDYQALVDALVVAIDPTARIRLKRQITQLEAEISQLTDQWHSLGAVAPSPISPTAPTDPPTAPTPTPSPMVSHSPSKAPKGPFP